VSSLAFSPSAVAPSLTAEDGEGLAMPRFDSRDLFQQCREIEIAHGDRIYILRLTRLNKLILTA
jgi:hemin uptake protein HemP